MKLGRPLAPSPFFQSSLLLTSWFRKHITIRDYEERGLRSKIFENARVTMISKSLNVNAILDHYFSKICPKFSKTAPTAPIFGPSGRKWASQSPTPFENSGQANPPPPREFRRKLRKGSENSNKTLVRSRGQGWGWLMIFENGTITGTLKLKKCRVTENNIYQKSPSLKFQGS